MTIRVFADQAVEEISGSPRGRAWTSYSCPATIVETMPADRAPGDQTVHVSPLDAPSDALERVEPGFALALHLDSAHGISRRLRLSLRLGRRREDNLRIPLMLAGGLTPENVGEAIARGHPWAVDVSSGTETDGRKDHERVRRFIDAVRRA
ncbi:MAG: hypothetical protein U0360_04055 [Dehalococcoidia bacterium]